MTNTINSVPRELLADLLGNDHDKRIMAERHLLAMLANAPSPAGVDGLEVVTYLHTLYMERGQTAQYCSKLTDDPFGVAGVDYSSDCTATCEPLCRLSDAQAIIDGLRGEVERLNSQKADWVERATALGQKADQLSKRVGELGQILDISIDHLANSRHDTEIRALGGSEGARLLLAGIDQFLSDCYAALSAGKEGE